MSGDVHRRFLAPTTRIALLLVLAHCVQSAVVAAPVEREFLFEEGRTYAVSMPLRPDPGQPQQIVDAASLEAEMAQQFGVDLDDLTLHVLRMVPGGQHVFCYPQPDPGFGGVWSTCSFYTDVLTWDAADRDAILLRFDSAPLQGSTSSFTWYGEEDGGPRDYGNLYFHSQWKSLPWDNPPADAATVLNEINAAAGTNLVVSVSKWIVATESLISYAGLFPGNNFALAPGEPVLIQVNDGLAEPHGACCLASSCSQLTESACTSIGGMFRGVGSSCLVQTCGQIQEPFDPAMVATQTPEKAYPPWMKGEIGPPQFGDPVTTATGEYTLTEIDLRLPGRGFDFVWGRNYRSRLGGNARVGQGWDASYDIRISAVQGNRPGEATGLAWEDTTAYSWAPPQNPGGLYSDLRYCTVRSTDPADFEDPAKAVILDPDGSDTETTDNETPLPGQLFAYLVRAKNGLRAGTLGLRSDGAERTGLDCGLNGPDLTLDNGSGRLDRYAFQPDGTWRHDQALQEFTRNPDGTYTLTYPDGHRWNFAPLDGSDTAGRLIAIADRNGNTQSMAYDGLGRLSTIVDTLGHPVTIGYDAGGFIQTVTDHTGRQVRYEYYDGFEPGGAWDDLKSVTRPAVLGTSTGNDFPAGKTTTYTYSTGHADPRLNHNLLTITDPRGHTHLENVYSPEIDPQALEFDRVVRQQIGPSSEAIDYSYALLTPGPANNNALALAIVNDRAGNVEEFYTDAGNRTVMHRAYTGRAAPDLPTTETLNRPGSPLRPTDPAYFETRWEYNTDSRPTRVIDPNSNEDTYTYDGSNPDPRFRANLLQHCRIAVSNPGPTPVICQSFEYDDDGGGFATNQITKHVNGRGYETLYGYDPAGNRTHITHRIPWIEEEFEYNASGQLTAHVFPQDDHGDRRRDEFIYYTAGAQAGRLETKASDVFGFAVDNTFEYDDVGNIVRLVDPRGNDTLFEVNQLDQIVRTTSREAAPAGPRYETSYHYDANDNLVRVDRLNLDEDGNPRPNSALTAIHEYDALNRRLGSCRELLPYDGPFPTGGVCRDPTSGGRCNQFPDDPLNCAGGSSSACLPTGAPTCLALPPSQFVLESTEYDRNDNPARIVRGEAAGGTQPENTVDLLYDERDLLLGSTRAAGHPDESTTSFGYDGNGNLIERVKGAGSASPRVFLYSYDGHDRLLDSLDPMGNISSFDYDQDHNLRGAFVLGEIDDLPGMGGLDGLADAEFEYDEMDRRTRRVVGHYELGSQIPIGDGQAVTEYEYDGVSNRLLVRDDNSDATLYEYDSMHRPITIVDPAGNRVEYVHDQNSNRVAVIAIHERDLGGPPEIFTTNYTYDGLDRRIRIENNIGDVQTYHYDSRGNLARLEDALRASPFDPGNVTRYSYDGLDRRIETERELRDDGTGGGLLVGTILTTQTWDDSSRLVARTDAHGNSTTYEYDPLDRRIRTLLADGTERLYEYDLYDNVVSEEDANGTQVFNSYDLLDRLDGRTVNPGPGVDPSTLSETFTYDGLSRLRFADNGAAVVVREYDSMSNVVSESINGTATGFAHDGVGNLLQTVYPGGRVIDRVYDPARRLSSISELGPGSIADFAYVGPRRIERSDYGNNTTTTYAYDGLARMIETVNSNLGGPFDHRTYEWDPMSNKSRASDVRAGGPGTVIDYLYDSTYRMLESSRVVPPLPPDPVSYVYDDCGNRESVTGATDPGTYTMMPLWPDPADRQMNQYTQTPFDDRLHDDNGNTVVVDAGPPGPTTYSYDYRNRLATADGPDGSGSYFYDALGRRIGKTASLVGPSETTRFFYQGWRVIEEQNLAGSTLATYVHGPDLDEVVQMKRQGVSWYLHHDDQYSTVAVTNPGGGVQERYEYGDFGRPRFLNGTGSPIPASTIDNPYLFSGRRRDEETGLYYYRTRYLDPRAGRFLTHDSIGDWGDPLNLGNGLAYAGNNPASRRDPLGHGVYPTDFSGASYGQPSGVEWDFGDGESNSTTLNPMHAGPQVYPCGTCGRVGCSNDCFGGGSDGARSSTSLAAILGKLDNGASTQLHDVVAVLVAGGGGTAQPLGVYPTDFSGASYADPIDFERSLVEVIGWGGGGGGGFAQPLGVYPTDFSGASRTKKDKEIGWEMDMGVYPTDFSGASLIDFGAGGGASGWRDEEIPWFSRGSAPGDWRDELLDWW